jgi:hypothetical protein
VVSIISPDFVGDGRRTWPHQNSRSRLGLVNVSPGTLRQVGCREEEVGARRTGGSQKMFVFVVMVNRKTQTKQFSQQRENKQHKISQSYMIVRKFGKG